MISDKRKSIIYIAGPISNILNYKDNFNRAESKLNKLGYIVLNPSVFPEGLTQSDYMKICIPMLYLCDSIYLLNEWEDSVGANIEYQIAKQSGMNIITEN